MTENSVEAPIEGEIIDGEVRQSPMSKARVSFDMYHKSGAKFMITVYGDNWMDVLLDAESMLEESVANSGYSVSAKPATSKPVGASSQAAQSRQSPPSKAPAAPAKIPATPQGAQEWVEVKTIQLQFSPSGKPHLKCKGGRFMQYGCTAWEEVVTPIVGDESWKEWGAGQDFAPVNGMEWMLTDGKKVFEFAMSN